MNEELDVTTTDPAGIRETPRSYGSDLSGIREASAELSRKRAEKEAPPPVSDEQRSKAKSELARRVGERVGRSPEEFDTDRPDPRFLSPKLEPSTEPLSVREASKGLSEYRAARDAELNQILGEQTKDAELDKALAEIEVERAAEEEKSQHEQRQAEEQERRAAVEHRRQQLSSAEQAAAYQLQAIDQIVAQKFPELPQLVALAQRDPAVIAQWAAQNPAKAAELAQAHAYHLQARQQLQGITQHRQAEQAAQFQQYAAQEDGKFFKAHPELSDKQALRALQDDAVEYLQSRGLSKERIAQLYTTSPEFRSAEAQAMLYGAVQHWRGERAVKNLNAHAKQLPPVQRPGVATGRMNAHQAEIENLSRQIDRAPNAHKGARAAAQLLVARRAAARR